MKVALIHNSSFPVKGYGGTERVVWWLAKGLREKGYEPLLVAEKGSSCPFARVIPLEDFNERMADVLHYFNTPKKSPVKPYVVTIGGNGKAGERYLPNTVFVSHNQAIRHRAVAYVHNGIDPSEYEFSEKRGRDTLFLAKASWKVKNVRGAIRLSRKANRTLHVMGGKALLLQKWRGVVWEGSISGGRKAELLRDAGCLLFPVLWDEPFGLAVVEALVSGCPVLATPFGSLRELLPREVGRTCSNDAEFLTAMEELHKFDPRNCRDWVLENFTHLKMTENYLTCYERVLSGERLNPVAPSVMEDQGGFRDYPVVDKASSLLLNLEST